MTLITSGIRGSVMILSLASGSAGIDGSGHFSGISPAVVNLRNMAMNVFRPVRTPVAC